MVQATYGKIIALINSIAINVLKPDKMNNKLYLLCFILVLFTNCNKSKNKIVERELAPFVDRFFEEAKSRDIKVSDDNLEVVFRDLSDEGVCGLGYFRFEGTDLRKVEINPDFFCWGFRDDFAKENLVFHELGHAILRRTHVNTSLPNGDPATLMCDGNICDVFAYYDQYTKGKRPYYLDKLFGLATGIPDWGRIKRKAIPYFEEPVNTNRPMGQLEFSDLKAATNFTYDIIENPISNTKSIQIAAKEKIPNGATGSWVIRLDNPSIEEGLGLRLKANMATENMEGEGVVMILRTLSGQRESLDISAANSTRNTTNIKGTQAMMFYEVDLCLNN